MQPLGDFTDQKAPGQRAEQDQFRPARDLVEQPGQNVAAQHQRGRHQRADAGDREQDHADLQIVEAGLHRQEQDRKNVLQHQHAERDTAGQRVEFTLLVQHLDDDHRARQCAGDAEIQRIELAATHRQADTDEEQQPEHDAANQLPAGGEQDDLAGAHDLLQVDLQPDHEQHEDQAEFGDDVDGVLGLDPAHAEWTNEEPSDKVGQDQRLPGKMRQKAEDPGEQDTESDIANKFVHRSVSAPTST